MSRLIKNSIIYTLLGFLAPAVNFFLIPIYTQELTPADFGIITLASLVVAVLINISGLGVLGSFSRYYYTYIDNATDVSRLFSSTFLIILGSSIAIGIMANFLGSFFFSISFKNTLFTYSTYGLLIIVTALIINIQTLVTSYYRNEENIKAYGFWSVLFFLSVVLGIYIGVVVLKQGALGSVSGRMWGGVIPCLLFLIFFYSKHPISWSGGMAKEMLKYGWPLVLYSTITFAFNSIDKVVVERYFNLEALGIYGFAFLVATVVEILITALNNSINPQVYRLLKQNDETAFIQIKSILNNSCLVLLFVMALMAACAGPLITVFINSSYHEVIFYLPLLILSYIPRLYFIYYSIPLFYYHKTKVLPLQSAISLMLSLAFNIVLIPICGIYGVCVSLFLTRLTQCLLAYFLCKKFKLYPEQAFNLRNSLSVAIFLLLTISAAIIIQPRLGQLGQIWIYAIVVILSFPILIFKNYSQIRQLVHRFVLLK